jgi:hypothetical protein
VSSRVSIAWHSDAKAKYPAWALIYQQLSKFTNGTEELSGVRTAY